LNPKSEGQTTQWPEEKGQTTQWPEEKGQTTQWPEEKGQKIPKKGKNRQSIEEGHDL
jgi:hypothetical protein